MPLYAGPQAAFGSAALRGGTLSVLGYTNNALSPEQKAAALGEILAHAAAGRLTTDRETIPLARAADVLGFRAAIDPRAGLREFAFAPLR